MALHAMLSDACMTSCLCVRYVCTMQVWQTLTGVSFRVLQTSVGDAQLRTYPALRMQFIELLALWLAWSMVHLQCHENHARVPKSSLRLTPIALIHGWKQATARKWTGSGASCLWPM